MPIRSRLIKAAAVVVCLVAGKAAASQSGFNGSPFDANAAWGTQVAFDRMYMFFDDAAFDPIDPAIQQAIAQGGVVQPATVIMDDSSTPSADFQESFDLEIYRLFLTDETVEIDMTATAAAVDAMVVSATLSVTEHIFAGDILTLGGSRIPVTGALSRIQVDLVFANHTSDSGFGWAIVPALDSPDGFTAEIDAALIASDILGQQLVLSDEPAPQPANGGDANGRGLQIVPPDCFADRQFDYYVCAQQRQVCRDNAKADFRACRAGAVLACGAGAIGGGRWGAGAGLKGIIIGGTLGCLGAGGSALVVCWEVYRADLQKCANEEGVCTATADAEFQRCIASGGNPINP
jgi:hypothetical protein